jgi:hypothetical protein
MFTVPTLQNFADYTEIVQLGGTTYRLRFAYNGRDSSWYVSLLGAGGDLLIAGVRVRLEWPLLRQHVGGELPLGELIVLDLLRSRAEPGRDDLRDGVAPLVFVPDDEVDEAVAGSLL